MLMEHGDFILPDQVPANEFLNLEGKKISTSRNWAVWLHEYLQDFPDQQDVLRYALCAAAPETKDNDFTWKDFQTRNNSELVAIYGNFVNRVLVLMSKYYDGEIPVPETFSDMDEELLKLIRDTPEKIGGSIERYRFREALASFIGLARAGNKYLADEEPWKVVKENPGRAQTIMYIAAQVCASLSQLGEPFLPFTSQRLRSYLKVDLQAWQDCQEASLLTPGHVIQKGDLLFKKIEDEAVEEQLKKLQPESDNKKEENKLPLKEEMKFEDFMKMDIRTGTILEAERVVGTDKLLKLTVDIGLEKRTIVSGIAGHYDSAKIIGTQVSVVANLAPKKLRGIVSQGMILMAEDARGKLVFASPSESIEPGSVIR